MDNNLFSKYQKIIIKKEDEKQILIENIYKETGIRLKKEEVNLKGKKISLNISSTKKSVLTQKGIGNLFKKLKLEYI